MFARLGWKNVPALVVGSLLTGLLSGAAGAADISIQDTAYVAPPAAAAPLTNWTGFYFGAGVGYGWGQISGSAVTDVPSGPDEVYDTSFAGNGWLASGIAGFDLQLSQHFVVGGFADYAWFDNLSGSQSTADLGGGYHKTTTADFNNLFTVGGRAGVLLSPKTLVYGLAGWTWAKANLSEFEGCVPYGSFCDDLSYSGSVGAQGATLGVGGEVMINERLSASLEYRWTHLASDTISGACTPNNGGNCGASYFGTTSAVADVQSIRATLRLRFGH
jgi:outer membrane immunogenic protein